MEPIVLDEETVYRMAREGLSRGQIVRIFQCSYQTLGKMVNAEAYAILVVNGKRNKSRVKRCLSCAAR